MVQPRLIADVQQEAHRLAGTGRLRSWGWGWGLSGTVAGLLWFSAGGGMAAVIRGEITWDEPKVPEPEQVLVSQHPGDLQRDVTSDGELRKLYSGSRVYTMERGEALVVLRQATNSSVRVGPWSEFYFNREFRSRMELLRGAFHFVTRGEPFDWEFVTPHVTGGHRGTEFAVSVQPFGASSQTVVTLMEGRVGLTNWYLTPEGGVTTNVMLSGRFQQAILSTNAAPRVLVATNLVQWWLYYPSVIAVGDLPLDPSTRERLRPALDAYAAGDVYEAERRYLPDSRHEPGGGERVFQAALALVRGRADEAAGAVESPAVPLSLGRAIRMVVAAVTGGDSAWARGVEPSTASEWLGYSYLLQAWHDLRGALRAATRAMELDDAFGYARIRAAELRFMLGDRRRSRAILEELGLGTRHPGAVILDGFLRAAEGRTAEAGIGFQRAVDLDPSLGDAWLGRGLIRIHEGDRVGLSDGLADLETAVAAEPERSLLHSYLGKAYQIGGDRSLAERELELARELDPRDPTPWLYLALLRQEENRINEGVRALQESLARNPDRGVYRSPALLDQDRAVRGANLALLYRDAGLADLSIREAAKALGSDYAQSTAHLFLADSYNNLRDVRQADLRYETPWFSEYLMANLLGPVGAGTLSPSVTANEYSRLFDRRRYGVSSTTQYRGDGAWYQGGAIHGVQGTTEFAVDTLYLEEAGERPNADVTSLQFAATVKQQIDPDDDLFLRLLWYEYESGDVRRLSLDSEVNPRIRFRDVREPEGLLGYHHAWQPGHDTLVLVAGARDRLRMEDPLNRSMAFLANSAGQLLRPPVVSPLDAPEALETENALALGSLEAQQIATFEGRDETRHRIVSGIRVQSGRFEADSRLQAGRGSYLASDSGTLTRSVPTPGVTNEVTATMDRLTWYAYDYWDPTAWLTVAGGVTYDTLRYPSNHRSPPLLSESRREEGVYPHAGVVVRGWAGGTIRAGYSRSLGGVSFDQSFRLEPTQVGGFNHAYRSLIPESVTGAVSGAAFEIWEAAVDQQVGTGLFLTSGVAMRRSWAEQTTGAFQDTAPFFGVSSRPVALTEEVDFEERQFLASVSWLSERFWALSLGYRLTETTLQSWAPGARPDLAELWRREQKSLFHEGGLQVRYNSPVGLYATVEVRVISQSLTGEAASGLGDAFGQGDAAVGYRFWGRRADLQVGVLNVTGEDYRLSPLNLYPRYPRERTLTLTLRLAF